MIKKIVLALAAASMAAAPSVALQANDTRIRVENRSNTNSIVGILAQNIHGQTFKVLSGGYTISPGYNRILDFDDGSGHNHCIYNIGAVFSNGTTAIRQNVNVCTTVTWHIYDLDNTLE